MSTRFPARTLVLILLLGLGLPLTSRADDTDFDTSMAQARVFIKKGWFREAVKELRRAVSTGQGEKSYDAHILLAQACFREFDIGCAITSAEKARGLARSPEERNSSQNVLDYFQRNFGKVEFKAGDGELAEGYLELEPQDPILDKDVKLYFKEKVAPLAEQRRTLPWIMYLPAVTYKLHGKEFTVEGGTDITVSAGFNAENAKPKPQKALPPPDFEGIGVAAQLRIGGGLTMDLGNDGMNVGPVADLSLHKTLGDRLAVGGFVKFNYEVMAPVSPALSYGGLVTFRLPISGKLSFSPAVGYAYGKGPTLSFADCAHVSYNEGEQAATGAKDGLVCGDPDRSSGAPQLVAVTASTDMHGPLARLEAVYEKRSEKRILAFYAGLQGQYGLFVTQSYDQVELGNSGDNRSLVVSENYKVQPLRVELLAGLNMTF